MPTTTYDADILGMLIIDPSLIRYAEPRISPEDFDDRWHQSTYAALIVLSRLGQQIDLYNLRRQMHAPDWIMPSLINMIDAAPDCLHAEAIIDEWVRYVRGEQ